MIKITIFTKTTTMNKLLILTLSALSAFTAQAQMYCVPPSPLPTPRGEILNVSIGTLNNTTAAPSTAWTYFSAIPAPVLYRDSTYVLSVTFDTVAPSGLSDLSWYYIVIPFDTTSGYLSFYTANRFVRSGSCSTTWLPKTDTFHVRVPHTAALTTTRLRVVRWGRGLPTSSAISPSPCMASPTIYGYAGETEDYNLSIQDAPIPPPIDTNDLEDLTHTANEENVITIPPPTHVKDITARIITAVHPNPANQYVNVYYNLPATADNARINIYTTDGRNFKTVNISKSFHLQTIDISQLPNGLYYYSVEAENTPPANGRFIKS